MRSDSFKLAKASTMALISMLIILITVVTQGFTAPKESKGPIGDSLVASKGMFQAIGVISFGKSESPTTNAREANLTSFCVSSQ